jgi:hypothetical protein
MLVITHPLRTPRFDRSGEGSEDDVEGIYITPLSRAVSIVVRTSASAFAAHMAR